MGKRETVGLDSFVKLNEVAELLGITRRTVYRWMDQGILPRAVHLGPGSVAIPESELRAFMERVKARRD